MRSRAADASVLLTHLADLKRLADSGRGWAGKALEPGAPVLFASSSGFRKSFTAAADFDHPLTIRDAGDLF